MNKHLMNANKREDITENLNRYERKQELGRQKKFNNQKKEMKDWKICKEKKKELTKRK